jgi:mRNA-degrading endonuclease toxin of MazEF toxin-antitoxin module
MVTLDKEDLGHAVGSVPDSLMLQVDQGLRQVLGL